MVRDAHISIFLDSPKERGDPKGSFGKDPDEGREKKPIAYGGGRLQTKIGFVILSRRRSGSIGQFAIEF